MALPPAVDYPVNPRYGSGRFHRRIGLKGSATDKTSGRVVAELEDCNHGFRVTVDYQKQCITDIRGEPLRVPTSACDGAVEPLKGLIDSSIQDSAQALNTTANPSENCTHMLDLTVLAIAHCKRGDTVRQYDVEVDDERDSISDIRVYLDGKIVHEWQARGFSVHAPDALHGNKLHKGFSHWARSTFAGIELEAAFILQKGYFVSQGRRYDINATAGDAMLNHDHMHGACYAYSSPRVENAVRLGNTVRDFSDTPELLLKFV